MKKKLMVVIVCGLSLLSSLSFAIKENKIIRVGYANYDEIAAKLGQSGKLISELKDLRASYAKQIKSLEEDVENLRLKLGNSPSEGAVNDLVKTYNDKKVDLEILKATAQLEISKKSQILLTTVKPKIESIIAQKAKQLGFDIIVDSSIVMIGKSNLDITKIILASL